MTVGLIVLSILAILTLFGFLHRVFDRMRLTDSQALLFIILIIIGSFINLPLIKGPREVSLNIGGGVLPVALAVYVLAKADTSREKWRAVITVIITAALLYGLNRLMANFGHGRDLIDPLYLYGLAGGLIAYLVSRSRRLAFITATLSVLALDFIHLGELYLRRMPGQAMIGGAGAFDAIVISGLIATLLAETVGETRERLSGGPDSGDELTEGINGQRGEK
ncbi:MAG: DUF1614 domain-containing protein [Bacillota bacterium]